MASRSPAPRERMRNGRETTHGRGHFQQIETDPSNIIDVWMIYLRKKSHFRRLKWILGRNKDFQFELPPLVWCARRAQDAGFELLNAFRIAGVSGWPA